MNIDLVLQAHKRWLDTDGKSGRQADFTGQTLDNDFSGADLSQAVLTGARIGDADFEGANLEGANLVCVHGQQADLGGAYLNDADLTGADLEGANLEEAILLRATLVRANLDDAALTAAILEEADLTAVSLRGAILRGTRLQDAYLTRAMLMGADFTDCDLDEAADLTGADLTDATLSDTTRTALNLMLICPQCEDPLIKGRCTSCGWRTDNRPQAERPRVLQVTRLVGDFAITPPGQPNMTRKQFESQRAQQEQAACEQARALARQAAEVRGFNDPKGGDNREAMAQLALAFHVLRAEHEAGRLKGMRPWDPDAFWASALQGLDDTGSEQAAAFILYVWDCTGPWAAGPVVRQLERREAEQLGEPDPYPPGGPGILCFDAHLAMRTWDRMHLAAFAQWAQDPWWG